MLFLHLTVDCFPQKLLVSMTRATACNTSNNQQSSRCLLQIHSKKSKNTGWADAPFIAWKRQIELHTLKEKANKKEERRCNSWRIKGFTSAKVTNASTIQPESKSPIHICQQIECNSGKDMSQSFGWSGNVKMLHIWRKSERMTQSCK